MNSICAINQVLARIPRVVHSHGCNLLPPPKSIIRGSDLWPPVIAQLLLGWFAVLLNVQAQICEPPSAGLVAWWQANESAGDHQRTSQGVLINGTGFTPGKVGQAFNFDGVDDYILVPDSDALRSPSISVEGWFRLSRAPRANNGDDDEFLLAAKYLDEAGWNLRLSTDLRPSFRVYSQPSSQSANATSGNQVEINDWVHLAGTYDGTVARIYVNGVEQGSAEMPGGYTPSSGAMTIGTASWFTGEFLAGMVDELSIYDRALSEATVRGIYAAADAGKCQSPIITAHPASQTVLLGANPVFGVTTFDKPPLDYQWLFNTTNLLGGETNASLTLLATSFEQAGAYSVRISNGFGFTFSSNAVLTVVSPTADEDRDGLNNADEIQLGTDPLKTDTDGDGFNDSLELFEHGTNPLSADTDGDGMPDKWETDNGLDPRLDDQDGDMDFDGLPNLQEFEKRDLGYRPNRADSFGDGQNDYERFTRGQTNRFYYDHNDRLIGAEYSSGIAMAYTYDGNDNLIRQTILSRAGEINGLPVLWRHLNGLTNDASVFADSDGDDWTDYQEWEAGTNPGDPASIPGLNANPGLRIASLQLPFTPTNFVVGVGQLDGLGAEELVIGADGDPGTYSNSLMVLTHNTAGWSSQSIDVGAFGITSIAAGQMTNRPGPGIYVGLHQAGGLGRILELVKRDGGWDANTVAISMNESASVLGLRGSDLLVAVATTNINDGSLSAVRFTTNWELSLVNPKESHRGQGALLEIGTYGGAGGEFFTDFNSGVPVGTTLVRDAFIDSAGGKNDTGVLKLTLDQASKQGAFFITNGIVGTNLVTRFTSTFSARVGGGSERPADGFQFIFNDDSSLDPFASGRVGSILGVFFDSFDNRGEAPGISLWLNGNQVANKRLPTISQGSLGTNYLDVYINLDEDGTIDIKYGAELAFDNFPIGYLPKAGRFGLAGLTGDGFDNHWIDDLRIVVGQIQVPLRLLDSGDIEVGVALAGGSALTGVEVSAVNRLLWRGISLESGKGRGGNAASVLYTFVDDVNHNNKADAGDDFVTAEYSVTSSDVQVSTLFRRRLASSITAASYGLSTVNFLNAGNDVFFTGEPDGQVFSWMSSGPTNSLERQIFSTHHTGKAWHAMAAVKTQEASEGLVGLRVDPNTPGTCDVIFWPPQSELPQLASLPQTPPRAVVLPTNGIAGSLATVSVRLWDSEGNAATPFLEYQLLGSTNWRTAKLEGVVSALPATPGGTNHALLWDAVADLGTNVATNVLMRIRASDMTLIGEWSIATPFRVETTVNPNSDNDGLPDEWERQQFGNLDQRGSDDWDGDGFTNVEEYLAGTDPKSSPVLTIYLEDGQLRLTWNAVPEVLFHLERRIDLSASGHWERLQTNPAKSLLLPADADAAYFRLRLGD